MRKITRAGAAAATLAVAGIAAVPMQSASAASTHHGPPPPPLGMIVVCNHSGYMFNVYADGPSIREDDLAGEMDECTSWDKVLTGNYQIGFGLRTTSTQNVIIQARFKRDDHVYYKVFNNEGVLSGFVNKDETMRVDLFIPQG
ncbi:MAG TPA: hypothetical protein VHV82_10930 [Sporichthyaceae bacterium]|jgi:hypothetical protein|nr:hypothetical protein [Sporichthyaceae bacterium]